MDRLNEAFERMARAAGQDPAAIAMLPPPLEEERPDDFEQVRAEREKVFFRSLPSLYTGMTFDSWQARRPLAEAVEKVSAWVKAYPGVPAGLFLTSAERGTGKTHMAVACGRSLAERGERVRLVDVVSLLNRIRNGFDNTHPRPDVEAIARYADVLILDDIGAEKPSAWVSEQLYLLVNVAVTTGTRLIVTSNDDYALLAAKLDERIVDRIIGATDRVDFDTTSYRVLQHKRRKA